MKRTIAVLAILMVPALSWAGAVVNSDLAPNPQYSRVLSLGTKGFANYSTTGRDVVKFKGATATGTATAVKVFLNGDESKTYITAEDRFRVQRGTVSKIGFRAYSSATPVFVHVLGE